MNRVSLHAHCESLWLCSHYRAQFSILRIWLNKSSMSWLFIFTITSDFYLTLMWTALSSETAQMWHWHIFFMCAITRSHQREPNTSLQHFLELLVAASQLSSLPLHHLCWLILSQNCMDFYLTSDSFESHDHIWEWLRSIQIALKQDLLHFRALLLLQYAITFGKNLLVIKCHWTM